MQPVAEAHQRSRAEAPKGQQVVVQDALRLGVAGVVHLEAAVGQHPVEAVGADPAADGVAGVQDRAAHTRCLQSPGAGEPGQSRTHHDDLGHSRSVGVDNRVGRSCRWHAGCVSEVWSLPGYDVQSLLGFGATGEVWRARELATGHTVALKRLRPDVDAAAVEALRREAVLLQALQTPYVVGLRALLGAGADAVLVLDHVGGGSLASLLARRGALDPGEVVTVAAPLASALAVAHERGIVHGDVTPANVLFSEQGMPVLSDLGVARLVGEHRSGVDGTAEYLDPAVAAGGEPDPAADVWALAAVCHTMLAGSPPHDGASVAEVLGAAVAGERAPLGLLAPDAPRALVSVVEAALAADPAARPSAADFATMLRRAHGVAPVRLADGPPAAPEVRPTHVVRPAAAHAAPRSRRTISGSTLGGVAIVVLVLAAAVVGWASGRGAAPAAPALPQAEATPAPDWLGVLEQLDAERGTAFALGDVERLSAVYAPDTPGLAADVAALGQLAAHGRTAHGLRHELRRAELLDRSGDTVRLRVLDVLPGYEVRSADGAVVSRAAGRGERVFLVDLVRTSEGWRLVQLRPET